MDAPPRSPAPVERVSDSPPAAGEWRADATAQSRHSRLDDSLVEPLDNHDLDRAATVCAEIARRALGDFAPALMLLSTTERQRLQALAAFALTLFDFARQSSLEGERLAQMNRWSFDLESTLDGQPPGQPVFVLLAAAGEQHPWSPDALEAIVTCARRRALKQRMQSSDDIDKESVRLASALCQALLPKTGDKASKLGATLLRVGRLLALGEDQRRHQAGLASDELPELWAGDRATSTAQLTTAIRHESRRLSAALVTATADTAHLPTASWRRATRYAILAARKLLSRIETTGAEIVHTPPQLGAVERLLLLLRSRWFPL